MGAISFQITSLTIVYSIVYSDADQRKHQSSASLAFVWGIHRGPVNSPHKWPVTRQMFPFDDVIMPEHVSYNGLMSKPYPFMKDYVILWWNVWHRTVPTWGITKIQFGYIYSHQICMQLIENYITRHIHVDKLMILSFSEMPMPPSEGSLVYFGNALYRRAHIDPPDVRRSWTDGVVVPEAGMLVTYHFFTGDIGEGSPRVCLQIWTVIDTENSAVFMLKWEKRVQLTEGGNRLYKVGISQDICTSVLVAFLVQVDFI